MPPYNNRRQPQDTRLWKKSREMDRRSTLQPRGNPGYRHVEGDSFGGRGLRTRQIVTRDGDGGIGRPGRHGDDDGEHDDGRNFHEFDAGPGDGGNFRGPNKPGGGPGFFGDDDSGSDGSDSDDEGNHITQVVQPPTTISTPPGSIDTLTPLVTGQTTAQPKITTTSLPVGPTPTSVVLNPAASQTFLNPGVVNQPTTDRKEEGDMNTVQPSSLTTYTESTPILTPTPAAATTSSIQKPQFDMDGDGNDDGGKHKWRGNKDSSRGGLDSTAEHLLIAAGAIGKWNPFPQ
ncbi:hypothetical protein M434DRAFT_341966 [Hypoxylon sp. CO27-5]|nr:hypothetical protein M434DRAFT_341966 [Hypoxylon sp. CO27-5]